ncbi:MAG: Imm32 family immunity protein [Pirellulales bacterium]
MAVEECSFWFNDMRGSPRITGQLEISKRREGVFIGGDPAGLRSLAKLLTWVADVDQEAIPSQPDGERYHVHLHARDAEGFNSLTPFSEETEVWRLDAKGTGELPEKYQKLSKARAVKRAGKAVKGKVPRRAKGKTAVRGRGVKRKT